MDKHNKFHPAFGLLHPGEDQNPLFCLNQGRPLYPVRHKAFDPNEFPQIPAEMFFHNGGNQFSYTVALTFTGWDRRDSVVTPTWHITVSPANIDVADALDIQIGGKSVTDELKRVAKMMGKALPLIYGSCAFVRVAHCGSEPAIIDAHLDFLHGANMVRRNYLRGVSAWWRWTYGPFPRGPLAPVPDLWHGVQNRQIIEDVLLGIGPEIIRRVEKMPNIARAMETRNIERAPESGHTIMIGGRQRASDRRAQQAGWTRCADSDDAQIEEIAKIVMRPREQEPVPQPSGLGRASDQVAPPPPPQGIGNTVTPRSAPMPVQGDGGLLDKGVRVRVSRVGTPNLADRKPDGGPKIS
ncbi:MAG: hypothetical protein UU40_C0001G0047 [Candidatus Uhrbacteria bacterium GW2011_GWD2_41_121]|uniref:Uncharacterized protein n=1 Tax=Candidatus Uhrbacteria bacterium GW2011_GWC1_41_20 TaxID=1618983 RepID=A0A0G0XSM9_9BACT|nr:MAG: hypothetical protein UT52_C0001G0023 [Candidatus Uhrbacteria bacterium GW2011_GWE1_39_46]KKR64412.1 MAG: hypothetical protein UU04_C0002G0023 [Candidatus Uhrbacteria bacterium GW2011_GWC2_40_450]KKR90709.1 MAG: hypothetical protein UU40_C0001G0047 [Candidatus Uhrbacteria bacterium GW2011_GWD2_41_121]KKR96574.1 MAG: hypothetical protein UU46_C0001G0023 [Candidatus Uhrbacteria bacterium GW2011_GWD1_41_16]KKR99965.1 MAG: hypothetical protein UU50_C0001G0023 [Candidatus Uhrbacteria bacteriu